MKRRSSGMPKRALAVLALVAALVGCSSGGSGKATEPSTTTASVWQPPAAGTYVPVAEIPPPSALRDNTVGMWMAAAQACREYDAAHGTTTSITVEAAADAPNGRAVSDTACIPSHSDPPADANAL